MRVHFEYPSFLNRVAQRAPRIAYCVLRKGRRDGHVSIAISARKVSVANGIHIRHGICSAPGAWIVVLKIGAARRECLYSQLTFLFDNRSSGLCGSDWRADVRDICGKPVSRGAKKARFALFAGRGIGMAID